MALLRLASLFQASWGDGRPYFTTCLCDQLWALQVFADLIVFYILYGYVSSFMQHGAMTDQARGTEAENPALIVFKVQIQQ